MPPNNQQPIKYTMSKENQETETTAASKALPSSSGSLARYSKMPDDGYGPWIGSPNNGGDVGDMLDVVDELNKLLVALHDAINQPKGVVPKSAEQFYQANTEIARAAKRS